MIFGFGVLIMIDNKRQFVWQSYVNNNCSETEISNLNKLSIVFVQSQSGDDVIPSNPFLAGIGQSYQNFKCGVGYMVYSNEAPYDAPNVVGTDYDEDNGRILSDFPMKFVIEGLEDDYGVANGEYKITTLFKNSKPTYKNENDWYVTWDGNLWTMCDDLTEPSIDCLMSNDTTGPFTSNSAPTPSPSPSFKMEVPDVPLPYTTTPTNDRTPKWTWVPVQYATSYEVQFSNKTDTFQTTSPEFTYPEEWSSGGQFLRILVRSVNSLGKSAWGEHTVQFDFTVPPKPSLSYSYDSSIANTSKPTITIGSTGQVVSLDIAVDGVFVENISRVSASQVYTFSQDLEDGTRKLYVRGVSAVGNKSQYTTRDLIIDTTPPSKPVLSGPESPTSSTNPRFDWDATGSQYKEVKLNGVSLGTSNNEGFYQPTLAHGDYTIQIRQRDQVGNWSEWSEVYYLKIDNEGPASPKFTTTNLVTNNLRPTWTWEFDEDVVLYEMRWDNSAQPVFGTTQQNSYTPESNLQPTWHRLTIRGRDKLGNWGSFSSQQIHIDTSVNKPLSLKIERTNSAIDSAIYNATLNTQPQFNWSQGDSDIINYTIKLDNDVVESAYLSKNYQFKEDISVGGHTFYVSANDEAGNSSAFSSYNFWIYQQVEFRWKEIDGKNRLQARKSMQPTEGFSSRDLNTTWSTVYGSKHNGNSLNFNNNHRLNSSVCPAVCQCYEAKVEMQNSIIDIPGARIGFDTYKGQLNSRYFVYMKILETPETSDGRKAKLRNNTPADSYKLVLFGDDNNDPENSANGDGFSTNDFLFSIILD